MVGDRLSHEVGVEVRRQRLAQPGPPQGEETRPTGLGSGGVEDESGEAGGGNGPPGGGDHIDGVVGGRFRSTQGRVGRVPGVEQAARGHGHEQPVAAAGSVRSGEGAVDVDDDMGGNGAVDAHPAVDKRDDDLVGHHLAGTVHVEAGHLARGAAGGDDGDVAGRPWLVNGQVEHDGAGGPRQPGGAGHV